MLLQFTVENVLSFRDEAVLSLLAAPGVEHAPGQVVAVEGLPRPVLRVAALYGPNASGKSNLVKALVMAQQLIVEGTRPGKSIAVVPFKLDSNASARPCRFEFELWVGGTRWSYGFACTASRVEAEWLYRDLGGEEHKVFERSVGDGGQPEIEIDGSVEIDEERRSFWTFVAEGTRINQLFLTEARERNVKELSPVLEALAIGTTSVGTTLIEATARSSRLTHLLQRYPQLLAFATDMAKSAGTGVSDLKLVDEKASETERTTVVEPRAPELRFVHSMGSSVADVEFDADEESDGTQRLVDLAPAFFLLMRHSTVVLVDELDRSLHTLLSRELVERFLAADASATGQLVFTTHDTNLLDLTLLPRDSIWFVEKDAAGGSTLYSLAEFKAEQLEQLGPNLERGYLSGRFGAIPFLGDPARLGWIKKNAS